MTIFNESITAHPVIFTGLSTDTKAAPDIDYVGGKRIGTLWYETDTGNQYEWDGTTYRIKSYGSGSGVNKFGRTTNADNGVSTDIHDGANPTDDVAVWVAPTQARVHQLVSTDVNDDGSPLGTGARTVEVFYLPDWDTGETSTILTMNGTTNVATPSCVIINRMKVLTWGSAGPNVGVITATADTDGTVTAQINAGEGQTQMAIYGIPSYQTFVMSQYYASVNRSVSTAVDVRLLINQYCDNELTGFVVKHTNGLKSDGSGSIVHPFYPSNRISGPAIIKLTATSSANNTEVDGGFDGNLESYA